jgi:hypothetical protein
MATETRGQNSWVNNQPANLKKPGAVYAEQKVALMPDEFLGEYPIERVTPEVVTNVEFQSKLTPGFTNAEVKSLTNIERKLGRAAFMRKVVEPIVKSENLPVTVAKGLGSWLSEQDPGITEAARLNFSQMSPMAIQRVLARVSQAAKQLGFFFSVPNPNGPSVAVTLDFGRALKEPEYKAAIERLTAADNGQLFNGTTMVKLDPAKVQIVLNDGVDERGAEGLLSLARQALPQYNTSGTVRRVDSYFPNDATRLDDAFAEYFTRIGYLTPEQAQAQQRAVTSYEQLAQAGPVRRALAAGAPAIAEAAGELGRAGLRRVAEMGTGPTALAAGRAGLGAVTGLAVTPTEAGAQGQGEGGGLGLPALLAAAAAGGPRALRGQFATRLFSRLSRAIDTAPFEKGTPQQWQAALSKGVAAGEREFTGIDEFLASTDAKTLTKAEVRGAFEQGRIRLGETQLGGTAVREQRLAIADRLGNAQKSAMEAEKRITQQYLDANNYSQIEQQAEALRNQVDAAMLPIGEAEGALDRRIRSVVDNPEYGRLGFDTPQQAVSAMRQVLTREGSLRRVGWDIDPQDARELEELARNWNNTKATVENAPDVRQLTDSYNNLSMQLTRIQNDARDYLRTQLDELPETRALREAQFEYDNAQQRTGQFEKYAQPGAKENYREVLLTLDGQEVGQSPYRSAHWGDVENPLLHVRMSDRQLPDGQKALFVEEIQSDWHQAGRKQGYRDVKKAAEYDAKLAELNKAYNTAWDAGDTATANRINDEYLRVLDEKGELRGAVPQAPFKKTPEWTELGLKRVIDEAVQGGYDRVVLVTGQQAADNFDLSRQISRLDWDTPDNGKTFRLLGNGDELASDVPLTKLPDYVGKDIADKIAAAGAEQRRGVLQGVDLKVGGDGMRAFYDKLVPNTLRDLGKSMGLKIELEPVSLIEGRGQNLSFRITPEAREKVMGEGMRLYDIGGALGEGLRTPTGRRIATQVAGLAGGEVLAQSEDEKLSAWGRQIQGLTLASAAFPAVARATRAGGVKLRDAMAQTPAGRQVLNTISRDILVDPRVKELVEAAVEETAKYRAIGQELAAEARKLGPAGDRIISDLVERESFEQAVLDPNDMAAAIALANRVSDAVAGLGQEKVGQRLISPTTFAARERSYLKRMYGKYAGEAAMEEVPSQAQAAPFRIKGEKQRLDLTPEQRNELGEIREASYRVAETFGRGGRDVASARLFNALVEVPGAVEPQYKAALDEVLAAKNLRDIALQRGDETAAREASRNYLAAKATLRNVSEQFKKRTDFVTLPDTPGLGVLRGAVVRPDVAEYLTAVPELSNTKSTWNSLLSAWKKIHTVYNPGTHVGNFVSNAAVAHMAGLPIPLQPAYLTQAAKDIKAYGPATKALTERGILERGLPLYGDQPVKGISQDKAALRALARTTRPETQAALAEQGIKPMGRVEAGVRALESKVTRAYALEDGVYRVALFQKYVNDGLDADAAAKKVMESLPGYDTRSPLLKGIKNTVSPFVLYPAKYIPAATRMIMEHPERWIALTALWAGLDQVSRRQYEPLEEKDLPKNQRSRGYILPGRIQVDAAVRPAYEALGIEIPKGDKYTFDVARWTPFSALTGSPAPGAITTQISEDIPGILQPGGPIQDIGALMLGRDPFTGDPLIEPGMTGGEKARAIGGKLASFVTPSAVSFQIPRVIKDMQRGDTAAAALDALGLVGLRPSVVKPGMQAMRERKKYEEAVQGIRSRLRLELRRNRDEERAQRLIENAQSAMQSATDKYLEAIGQRQ